MGKTNTKRALIHNPYWDSMGGGERYCATVIKVLLDLGWQVCVDWKNASLSSQIKDRFEIDINAMKIVEKHQRGWGYDLCFWVSDGSVPLLFSQNNLLHMQIPFHGVGGEKWVNQQKLKRIKHVVCNSNFTKTVIDREFKVSSEVIYPPVDVNIFHPAKKEKIILYVGRFSRLKQNKNQEFLIDFFKKVSVDPIMSGWQLILAGGVGVGNDGWVSDLIRSTQKFPIAIVTNPSLKELIKLYGRAKVFISASGYGVDQIKFPDQMEHFGITVVEAMASGCIPVVYNGGGHREIVNSDFGYLWNNQEELESNLLKIVKGENINQYMSQHAIETATKFSSDVFAETIIKLCN